MSNKSLDNKKIIDLLMALGRHLEKPAKLLLIGSSVGIQLGQPGRMTGDIDVWMAASNFDYSDLLQACKKSGVELNPAGYDDPVTPYIQIISEGIVDVGEFTKETRLLSTGNLAVTRPPIENIIASKLVRGSDHDYDDMLFLFNSSSVTYQDIENAISTLHENNQALALENLELLRVLVDSERSCLGS